MDKKLMLRATVIFLGFAMCWSLVAGAQSIWFSSDLTVPTGSVKLYESDGITEIFSGTPRSYIWSWNDATKSFTATIQVENIGSATCSVAITSTISSPWIFTYTGIPTGLIVSEKRSFGISIANPSAMASDKTGSFQIQVDVV